jgi:segregation and condensation protein B
VDFLIKHIEALIFSAKNPITIIEIQRCLSEMFDAAVSEEDIANCIEALKKKYADEAFAFEVFGTGGGYRFLTKPAYQASISILLKQQSKKRLSTAALETLAIVAYKQPITKAVVEQIRGVGCDYALQKLLDKSLIEIKGKDTTPGRPILYGTSAQFIDYFGINSLQDLPTPRDFARPDNEIAPPDPSE